MNRLILTIIALAIVTTCFAQSNRAFAESIRLKYKIPELAYAVVSSDSIFEIQSLGFQSVNSTLKARLNDKFRLGSCTKTITSYIAELIVKQGLIKWDTKFFAMFPELKSKSNKAYHDFNLKDLLTLRANLMSWTYTNEEPTQEMIKGNVQEQRYEFITWILQQPPSLQNRNYYFSNPSYVAAGLMLEKATGKNYETLVADLGKSLGIKFDFGQPNLKDVNQPWGHNANLEPEKPVLNYKLNWLSAAGNINVSLPDYTKFIQLQLQGLLGRSKIFSSKEFEYFHYGLPDFSFGWKSNIDDKSKLKYSYHEGNPGTFLTKTFICKDIDKAFIIFANVQSDEAENGINALLAELKKQYGG
jgi:CubicO group peptidase (beta-lactamase class C family)